MFKHTKGPWVARRVIGPGWPGQMGYAIDYNEDQEQVVDFVYEEADARLIAAAPELLSALDNLIDVADRYMDFDESSRFGVAIAKARAAISKATA